MFFAAAIVAAAFLGAGANIANAAGIVIDGAMQLRPEITVQPSHLVGLDHTQSTFKGINGDGTSNSTLHWLGVQTGNPPYTVDYVVWNLSDVPTTVVPIPSAPNNVPNSDYFIAIGDLPETKSYFFRFDVDGATEAGNMHNFLKGATVHAGFGPLSGTPTTIEEAIAMTQDGSIVLRGNYPLTGIEVDEAWGLHTNYEIPMPGDYNRDGDVDWDDYHHWRATFGTIVDTRGEGADGNRDGIVDAADYVVWRKHVPPAVAGLQVDHRGASVPEPQSFVLVILTFGGVLAFLHRTRKQSLAQSG